MAGRKLTDDEALARLRRASDALGVEDAEGAAAQTALDASRRVLFWMAEGLEGAADEATPTPAPQPEP